jgi:hypothetical protein
MKLAMSARIRAVNSAGDILAALSGVVCVAVTSGAVAATSPDVSALQATWRASISQTPTPAEGCFKASYPTLAWSRVDCVVAPNVPYFPRSGMGRGAFTVGDGHDYAIKTQPIISSGVGSFPVVTGVTKETDEGAPNTYSLQLNSQFYNGAACAKAKTPSKCLSWLQYIYSSSEKAVFMQYWLIYYDTRCPSGWMSDGGGDCYKNSAAVRAPQEPITDLQKMSVTGSAVTNGVDTTVFADGSNAYTTTGKDTVVYLAKSWDGAEFNVVGDGGGSEAVFNTGSSITVGIAVKDGSTVAPTCAANAGTTGETNNLTLGVCKTAGGSAPSISFVESN